MVQLPDGSLWLPDDSVRHVKSESGETVQTDEIPREKKPPRRQRRKANRSAVLPPISRVPPRLAASSEADHPVLENLRRRFPTADEALLLTALERNDNHGGNAGLWLQQQMQ